MKNKKNIWKMLPAGWHEVSFNVAQRIIEMQEDNPVKVVSLLIGESEEVVRRSTDIEKWNIILSSCLFLQSLPLKKNPEFPKSVLGHDLPWVNYSDYFDLGKASVGQVEDMKNYLSSKKDIASDEKKFQKELIFDVYPVFCAIYMQPIIDSAEYDYDRATSVIIKTIKEKVDFKTILNMGAFFLMRLPGSTAGYQKGYTVVNRRLRKLKLVLMNLVQRLVSILP